ncbi:MAG: SipW-dependent-type signal peptide-containing protein [Patescibacteria group bacterium]
MLSIFSNVRVLFGSLIIVGAVAALATGLTGAFFSDTETSTNNRFTAGAIDLKVDNESWYNGNECVQSEEGWVWQGPNPYPVSGTPCTTSFLPSDLDAGYLFFDFLDLKPDDEGEDTISLHVQNDAWACMDLTLTSNDDNSTSEPESLVDQAEDPLNFWDGELAQNLQFLWWADDGDNVHEVGEKVLSDGVETLYNLATSTGAFSIVLADSTQNAWGLPAGTPLPANETVYIAKAWCLGTLTDDPVPDNGGVNPGVDPGVNCDGTLLNNLTQTDGVELTLAFSAVQARNNESFRCNPPDTRTATLTVNKATLTSTAGIEVGDFTLHIVGPNGDQVVSDEIPTAGLPAGSYTTYEVVTGDVLGKTFITTFSGVCSNVGNSMTSLPFAVNPNDNVTCVILNDEVGDFIPPTFN